MRVAVFGSKPYDKDCFRAHNTTEHEFTFFAPSLNEDTVPMVKKFDAVCCFVNDAITKKVIRKLAKAGVKLIALRCAGFNNIDLEAAKAENLTVCRVPEYSPYTVAEHAVALIMDLNRNIHRAFNRVRENDYSLQGLQGFEMHGKTVGIVGTGAIGIAFAAIMRGFGCRVIAHDPFENPQFAKYGSYVELDELWSQSDIISLHCPLVPPTYHLINSESINQMKQGVMLINTSRGGLIDTPAVIASLKGGHIGYLGLDVYEEEVDLFFEDNSNRILTDDVFARLLTFPNVVVTGHQAFFSREALDAIARMTITNIDDYFRGRLNGANLVKV